MLKKECQFDSIAPLLKKLVGDDSPLDTNLEKPDLFGQSFIYNPQNYVYAKISTKSRQNTVGVDNTNAVLLE